MRRVVIGIIIMFFAALLLSGCGGAPPATKSLRSLGAITIECDDTQPREAIFSQQPFEGKIEITDLRQGKAAGGWVWNPWVDVGVIKADDSWTSIRLALYEDHYMINGPGVGNRLLDDKISSKSLLPGPVSITVQGGKAVIETAGKAITVDDVKALRGVCQAQFAAVHLKAWSY